MELTARGMRQSTMMSPRQVRGTVLAVLLCSALAGCGSVAASAPAGAGATSSAATSSAASSDAASSGTGSSGTGSSASAPAAAAATGCASVNQATSVTVHRVMHLVEPTRAGALTKTQHNATLVRALFGQLCAAVSHPARSKGVVRCPVDLGISYLGTFFDGSRPLAKFIYAAGGCQSVSLTTAGKTKTTIMFGSAATAAPKLRNDMAAVLGVPSMMIAQPTTGTNKSGPNK
jgi:uncharacterized protein YceK